MAKARSSRSRPRSDSHRAIWRQTEIEFPNTWGGKREGAGRKRMGARRNVPHRTRLRHFGGNPVHVTLRSAFRPLRSQHVFPTVCLAIREATRRNPKTFRILHFSVQWDHVHLVVEASDERALSSGVAGVAIRMARAVNELVMRRGRFWADRWHGTELASPRQVRNALAYVLGNFRKHANSRLGAGIDAFSSATLFDGWHGEHGVPLPRAGPPLHAAMARYVTVSKAITWLGTVGWRRAGLIRLDESPRGASRRDLAAADA